MRVLRIAVLPLLVVGSLAAQAPPPATEVPSPAAAVSPLRGAFFDLAALAGDRARLGLEPLRLGSWTLDLVASRTRTSTVLMDTHVLFPPAQPGPVGSKVSEGWSLDVAVRYYPAPLALGARRSLAPYVAAFVGYQSRTFRLETDVVTLDPLGRVVPASTPSEQLRGFEPGAEAGLRLTRLGPLFLDVGGWFQLVTIDDPARSRRPGQIDARLVAAVGLGW